MRKSSLPPGAIRVSDTLISRGHHGVILTRPEPIDTAEDAARALGVDPGAIVEAQVFLLDDEPVLLLVGGGHRVQLESTSARLEGLLTPAPEALTREVTGQPAGGVAPLGHPANLSTWVDTALAAHPQLWAAGGHPGTLFRTSFTELVRITAGQPVDMS
ncbi:YbaK/EbsC family protein [Nocardia sp. NPDC050697]|uniref:YbaK/EbsC family protein n=1 Tax=Nocardia sp. NPDC050697 TaxID=3155158 RepID=UPI0033DBD671